MTLEEFKTLNLGGRVRASIPASAAGAAFVPPVDETTLAQIKTPEESKTYNGLCANDIRLLNKYKYSDDLHRPDLINGDYKRAESLEELGAGIGANEFIKSYLN